MLIKKIIIKNFRQYKDCEIVFSTDSKKNVTVIMGDNGTGKTTLAQAFQWALYGNTNFQVRELINRIAREEMKIGESRVVLVSLDISYNGKDYTIKRSITCNKNGAGKLEEKEAKFTISYMDENGNIEYAPDHQRTYLIKRILPQQLSRYFFFDGEKIELMAEEMRLGKSDEFKEAVYSLVGLTATQNAIEHLKSGMSYSKKSVLRVLRAELEKNNKSIEQMTKYNNEIENYTKLIEEKVARKKELEEKRDDIEKQIDQMKKIIFQETPKMQLKEEYIKLEKEIQQLYRSKNQMIGNRLLSTTYDGLYAFSTQTIFDAARNLVKDDVPDDKLVPGLTSKTVNMLLERGRCLCGTQLSEGTLPYQEVESLLDFAYPKTISMLIDDYFKTAKFVLKGSDNFYEDYSGRLREMMSLSAQIEGKEVERDERMESLANTSNGEIAKEKLQEYEIEKSKCVDELINLTAKIRNLETERMRKESEKEKLVIVDSDARRNLRYLAYAEALYQNMKSDYTEKEDKYRNRLQIRMNEVFEKIYDGKIRIEVDAKYRIKVNVEEENASDDEVERNTAQGYALVFSFISSIIDLAKEKVNDDAIGDEEKIDVEKEGYPMVMDAPLSAFDKTRIKKICYEIPRIADQVIMFIKDTDGDIAEAHMEAKIGRKYLISKVEESSLHSEISER